MDNIYVSQWVTHDIQ